MPSITEMPNSAMNPIAAETLNGIASRTSAKMPPSFERGSFGPRIPSERDLQGGKCRVRNDSCEQICEKGVAFLPLNSLVGRTPMRRFRSGCCARRRRNRGSGCLFRQNFGQRVPRSTNLFKPDQLA